MKPNRPMITDNQMILLGFSKVKTYKKKERGVSSFCWYRYGFVLTIEKCSASDSGDDFFIPTLNIGSHIFRFTELDQLKELLRVLRVN